MKYAFICAFVALTALAAQARAQTVPQDTVPEATRPVYIAMLYEKLLHQDGTEPDFGDWVRATPAYNKAQLYERPALVEKNSKKLENTYDLLTPTEPIVIHVKAHLSSYSAAMHAFLVQNFQEFTYFDYDYLGQQYALVPNGISKYQWLKALPVEVPDILRESDNGRDANIVITLIPLQADPKPMELNGAPHHLLMGDISKIEIWSKDGKQTVWDDEMEAPHSLRSKILDLFGQR